MYNLPEAPRRPAAHLKRNYFFSFAAALGLAGFCRVVSGRAKMINNGIG